MSEDLHHLTTEPLLFSLRNGSLHVSAVWAHYQGSFCYEVSYKVSWHSHILDCWLQKSHRLRFPHSLRAKDRPWRDSVEPDPANLSDALTAEAEEAGSWVVKH